MKVIKNAIKTPDGTILESFTRHDFVQHTDRITEETYWLDGGHDYQRRSVNKVEAIDLSVWIDDPFETIREAFQWGRLNSDDHIRKFTYLKLKELTNQHICKILETQTHISQETRSLLERELEYRKENNIFIKDEAYA